MSEPRLISGRFGGRKLRGPVPDGVRPTTDRVRSTLFNILENLVDWPETAVLDLYCGIGTLGLEALSRGARQVTFVDNAAAPLVSLKGHLAALQPTDEPPLPAVIVRAEVTRFLASPPVRPVGLVLLDPPYDLSRTPHALDGVLGRLLAAESGWLAPDGLVVVEHPPSARFAVKPVRERGFGVSVLSFFEPTAP